MDKKEYYLDYNASTPLDPKALDALLPYLKDLYHNPSSKYNSAMNIAKDVERARATIADILGAKSPEELIFTGSATESINHAIRGSLKIHPEKKHIISTAVEHPAVLETCKDLERDGYRVTFLKVNNKGELSEKEFLEALCKDTCVISIMHANNETGVIFPIDKLSKIAKELFPEVVFHTDATQSIGKLPIKMYNSEYEHIDLLSMSGHKVYAPKGIGLLFNRRGTRLRKFITGGHHEFNKRGGTLNVPFIIALAKAFELLDEELKLNKQKTLGLWIQNLEKEIQKVIPYSNVNGAGATRLSNTTNISFDCIEGESILFQLDKAGFCISSGSACTSGSLEPSHVLRAMHVPLSSAHSSLRISLGRFSSEDDCKELIKILPGIISRLREISPFWDKKNNKPSEQAMQYSCEATRQ